MLLCVYLFSASCCDATCLLGGQFVFASQFQQPQEAERESPLVRDSAAFLGEGPQVGQQGTGQVELQSFRGVEGWTSATAAFSCCLRGLPGQWS